MSVSEAWTLYMVQLAGGDIDQITDFSVGTNVGEVILGGDGEVYNRFAAAIEARPVISFTTTAIHQALNLTGVQSYKVSATATMFFQQMDLNAVRLAGANHLSLTNARGLVIPRTLRAEQGSAALLSYDFLVNSSDGTTAPITFTASQSLTGSPATGEAFTVGACQLNAVAIKGVQSFSVDFGVQEMVIQGDGDHYPTFAAVQVHQPSITIRCFDVDLIATHGTVGTAISAATDVTLKEVAEGATPNGTTRSLTINEGRITATSAGGGHGQPQMCDIRITPTYDGTNAPLVYA